MAKETIKNGKYVSLSYSIVDDDNNVVEQHDLPLGFVYGSDTELLGGMDKAIFGKSVGDGVEVILDAEDTFGAHDAALTFTDSIDNVPPEFRRIGAEVQMQNEAGETKTFYVSNITDTEVTVDGNHPLAGKELTIKVNILEVRDAIPGEEKATGIHSPTGPGSNTIN